MGYVWLAHEYANCGVYRYKMSLNYRHEKRKHGPPYLRDGDRQMTSFCPETQCKAKFDILMTNQIKLSSYNAT